MNSVGRIFGKIHQAIAYLVIELPAKRAGMDRMIERLERSGKALDRRAKSAGSRAGNLPALTHIIGIERWGQRRLRVALGEPLTLDEYNAYRPSDSDWTTLRDTFQSVRLDTISLCKSLRMAGVDPNTCVRHNQLGEISLLGWLYYLNMHANLESKRIF